MFHFLIEPQRNAGVGVAFTDREGGVSVGARASLNIGRTDEDDIDALRTNMGRVRSALGVDEMVALHQVHGTVVFDADTERDWSGDAWLGDLVSDALPIADASITSQPGRALMIRIADCVPVMFAAGTVVAGAHAGRVGLLGGVLSRTVEELRERTDEPIRAWIGPHICGACYEVPEQMAVEAEQQRPGIASTTSWGTPALDLGGAAAAELEALGVEVFQPGLCTLEQGSLFSHRGDGPDAGRQAGIIWLAD